jgi:IPT/TIG domain-containing protein/FG-GAP repeat protein
MKVHFATSALSPHRWASKVFVLAVLATTLAVVPAATGGRSAALAPGGLFVQQLKLVGGNGIGPGCFGASTALSDDGMTALIGGYCDNGYKGAAWLFSRRSGTWSQQFKFTGVGEVGGGNLGYSVALSADGRVALVGAYYDTSGRGAAWVFTASGGSSVWVGQKLTGAGEIGNGQFGRSVALSASGTLAMIGAPGDDSGKGAAWVYRRSGSSWLQSGPKLKASGAKDFGRNVALSSNAGTALIGAQGSVYVFNQTLSGWAQWTTLTPPTTSSGFGAVALSGDGTTALIGGIDNRRGAAWFFKRSGQVWVQDGPKLTADNEIPVTGPNAGIGAFGSSVALSADGSVALIGAMSDDTYKGAAWLWLRAGALQKLTPGQSYVGYAVALARDGNLGLVGATQVAPGGAAWVFANPIAVFGISPASGPTSGGTVVRIDGTGFSDASAVRFGTRRAASFTVKQDGWINAVSPPGQAGTVDVTVTTSAGTSAPVARGRFTYVG